LTTPFCSRREELWGRGKQKRERESMSIRSGWYLGVFVSIPTKAQAHPGGGGGEGRERRRLLHLSH